MEDKILETMLERATLLNTLLACFYINDSDELIPNENWHRLNSEEKEKVREYFRGID